MVAAASRCARCGGMLLFLSLSRFGDTVIHFGQQSRAPAPARGDDPRFQPARPASLLPPPVCRSWRKRSSGSRTLYRGLSRFALSGPDHTTGNLHPGTIARSGSAGGLHRQGAGGQPQLHRLYSGLAHSTLGYTLLKQEKTIPAIAELKTATTELKGTGEAYSGTL